MENTKVTHTITDVFVCETERGKRYAQVQFHRSSPESVPDAKLYIFLPLRSGDEAQGLKLNFSTPKEGIDYLAQLRERISAAEGLLLNPPSEDGGGKVS